MHTVKLLTSLIEHHQVLAYAVIFFGLIFEGEVTLLAAGIMAHLGAINFFFALGFVLCGAILKTFFGYKIGSFVHDKWHKTALISYLEKRVYEIMPRFNDRPFWSIFISKFIMGANHVVIIFSGYVKVKYETYLKAELLATAIWAPLLMSLGFYFSYAALGVSREIWRFLLTVVMFAIGFIIVDKVLGFIYEMFEESYDHKRNQ